GHDERGGEPAANGRKSVDESQHRVLPQRGLHGYGALLHLWFHIRGQHGPAAARGLSSMRRRHWGWVAARPRRGRGGQGRHGLFDLGGQIEESLSVRDFLEKRLVGGFLGQL